MRRVVVRDLSGPLAMTVESFEKPAPAAGEVLIRVEATGLGFVDGLIVRGKYQIQPELPYVPGGEIAGVIAAVGTGVEDVAGGDRVAVWQLGGGLAEYAIALAKDIVVLPEGLDARIAALAFVDYLTAHYALVERGCLRRGETALVLGAAGGVGQAAIQTAAAQGARVIAVVSSAAKAARVAELGAAEVIVHQADQSSLRESLRDLDVDGRIDVVFDPIGGEDFESVFRSLGKAGRHLVVGFASGTIPKLPANLTLLKSASLVGVDVRHFVQASPDEALSVVRKIFRCFTDGSLKEPLCLKYSLDQAGEAFARLSERGRIGKIVVEP
ncbi:NADPH:quinone oxidoreductase family protein [Paraburkholderia sp. CNPSo 3076]|uniref:NADPH:quinone oxidoreductase family protein n=1 Tax=Paraburkholderia sp. CNPSo 3076 TaxID=2940936 RepID=UPI002255D746|nr:NADPH:quinone oxidoreductase family protein [Paraburkholderia sp. CNPSo 3076]MCX5542129.1 NADPH:quinone oxidoreductase family protein [Paraburkholderia sp. CNPSo 3076]